MRGARGWGGIALLALVAAACAGSDGLQLSPAALEQPEARGADSKPAHVVVLSVAGLEPALYHSQGGQAPVMPNLAALGGAGVSADRVTSVAPAAAYPAHATMLTGRLPAAHGVPANRRLGDHGVRVSRYFHASQLRSPTLWQLAGEAKLRVAALAWPTTVGASIDLLLPDLVPTRQGETWLGVLGDSATPAVLELATRAGGADAAAQITGSARDAVLVTVACSLFFIEEPPALLLLRLSQTSVALAHHGPGSPASLAAFAHVDAEIARLFGCLEAAHLLRRSALVVVGDHGTVPIHTVFLPNAVLADKGLITAGPGVRDELMSWSAIARSNGGSAFVYAAGEREAVLARRALSQAADDTGAFRVVPAAELLDVGADPRAWFGLEAEPGFGFADAPRGATLQPAAGLGIAGFLPGERAMDAGFVAWGRGFRSGIRVPSMRLTDLAPTLARLMGLELTAADGRVLVGVLDVKPTRTVTVVEDRSP